MSVRNHYYIPTMEEEGVFLKTPPTPPGLEEGELWYKNIKPHHRLYYHQTLNSIRKYYYYRQKPLVPKDNLDLVLQAYYNHSKQVFTPKVCPVLQKETVGIRTFRKTSNYRDVIPPAIFNLGHPLKYGGIKERISPHSVKLINSGHHTQLTNNGYSRQPADGNFFKY